MLLLRPGSNAPPGGARSVRLRPGPEGLRPPLPAFRGTPILKALRHVLLVLLFLGLTALEIGHGVFRLNTLRDDRHREILAGIEKEHNDLARVLRSKLRSEREHAAYLARLPAVRRLLRAEPGAEEPARNLETELLPYLVSFRGIDRVRVLDPRGLERFRCERIGDGVGALPWGILDAEPDTDMLSLIRGTSPGEVVLSELTVDTRRIEVPASERQVLHFATTVHEGPQRLGILVLTVYAAPLLGAIRSFTPLPGVHSLLVTRDGSYLASTIRTREIGGPDASDLRSDYPEAAEKILSGATASRTADGLFLSLLAGEPHAPWRLVTFIPNSALDEASSDLRGEYAWVLGSIVLTTVVLIFAGAFLLRMSVREFRLREAARYEKRRQEIERQMQLSERLGSLGLLTAGVAHEINNPLEGIENYLALLEREPLPEERRRKYLDMVRYGFHRIRDIVRDLSAFARPNVRETTADVGEVVRHAIKMVGYSKEFKGIEVILEGLDAPLQVPGDPGRLEQVFINLLLNGARALRGEGSLYLRARRTRGSESNQPQVEVTIEDTGPGIPPEHLSKIFDPFFTTHDGTGLGLSISYGILRAHGGNMVAENRAEGGARFILELPASEDVVAALKGERRAT